MKFLRNRFISKFIASLFLILIIQSVVAPTVSWALTNGPHQPEYTGYEEPGATDMVNLLTGDFSYNIPAISIPGPEGGFDLPLSYSAGIGMNQDASWVGLGWSLNAGAIVRNVVQYPDDANGEVFEISRTKDDIERGWFSNTGAVGSLGWNSNDGHTGRISILGVLGFSYSNGSVTGINALGLDINSKGVKADPVSIASAAATVASFVSGRTDMVVKMAVLSDLYGMQQANYDGIKTSNSNAGGYWNLTTDQDSEGYYTNYWTYLDQTREEEMYGLLNLGKMKVLYLDKSYSPNMFIRSYTDPSGEDEHGAPVYVSKNISNVFGAASDMHYAWSGKSYEQTNNPTSLAKDNYNVMGPGVSGSIEPYRLDVGSLSMPRDMGTEHLRLAMQPHSTGAWPDVYKVQFKYSNNNENTHYQSVGGVGTNASYTVDPNNRQFGISLEDGDNDNSSDGTKDLTYRMTDPIFPEYFGLTGSQSQFEENRAGLYYKKLAQGKQINWYTKSELMAGVMGFPVPTFGSDQIGGFSVTREDGKTYYYAQAIWEKNDFTYIESVDDPTDITTMVRKDPFASTWLLTGITGSDFVDRNDNQIMDEEDWGYWIEMSYGQFSNRYKWRSPRTGYSVSADGKSKSYSEGRKELYYLNSIKTRTHTALFIKEVRNDGVDSSEDNDVFGDNTSAADQNPSRPMSLNKVVILPNDKYSLLVSQGLTKSPADQVVVFPVGGNIDNVPDLYANVWDVADVEPFAANIAANSLRKVVFNYDYDLCKVPDGIGKLSLKSLSILGRNNVKTIPDFKFEYNNNPNYNIDKWDGWGMYNPNGTSAGSSHKASNDNAVASVWSMSKITTPIGSDIEIEYERDSYASIAGNKITKSNSFSGDNWNNLTVTNASSLQVGEYVRMTGTVEYNCQGSGDPNAAQSNGPSISTFEDAYIDYGPINFTSLKVTAIVGNLVTFEGNPPSFSCSDGSSGNPQSYSGLIYRTVVKKGGNIRVKSITATNDIGEEYKTKYLYTVNIGGKLMSSGVIGKEPEYIKTKDYSFYELFDFPFTPVMYKKVAVQRGVKNDQYDSKEVYEFITPNQSMVDLNKAPYQLNLWKTYETFAGCFCPLNIAIKKVWDETKEYTSSGLHTIDISTSQIGKVKSINLLDSKDNAISETVMTYNNGKSQIQSNEGLQHQGLYSESTLLVEKVLFSDETSAEWGMETGKSHFVHRAFRTTKRYYPTLLEKIVTTNEDGLQTISENKEWDFITGKVLKKQTENSLGIRTLTETIPAYKEYPGMGPKSISESNSHMLGAEAATYVYKLNASDVKIGLIGASVQTWKKDWSSYREANVSTGVYANVNNGAPRWRKHAGYLWQGDAADLQDDGTLSFSEADRFNFSAGTHTGWQYGGEVTRFDVHSLPVESKDLNNLYTTTKTDVEKSHKVLEAGNAKYTEVAYSGAEYDHQTIGGKTYLDGEVRITTSSQLSTSKAHTGDQSIRITSAGQKGFHYVMQSGEYDANRSYRLGVWVHQTNANKGELYYTIGGSTQTPAVSEHQAGDGEWTRLEMLIPASTLNGATLEVGVRKKPGATSGDVYVDDFRFQPMDAGMTGYVYNDLGQLTHMLDNENRFTEYVYNDAGRLTTTYVETFQYGKVKVSESDRHYSNMGQ